MSEWTSPPHAVWVWGKYGKYDETYCHSEEIKQEDFEIPITKYVRADIADAAPDLLEAVQSLIACLDLIDKKYWCEYGNLTSLCLQDAQAAIAKALGEDK